MQQVAACCTLHNVCEIHGDSFDDSWEVANPEDTRASSGVANQSSLTSGHDVREALPHTLQPTDDQTHKRILIEN